MAGGHCRLAATSPRKEDCLVANSRMPGSGSFLRSSKAPGEEGQVRGAHPPTRSHLPTWGGGGAGHRRPDPASSAFQAGVGEIPSSPRPMPAPGAWGGGADPGPCFMPASGAHPPCRCGWGVDGVGPLTVQQQFCVRVIDHLGHGPGVVADGIICETEGGARWGSGLRPTRPSQVPSLPTFLVCGA